MSDEASEQPTPIPGLPTPIPGVPTPFPGTPASTPGLTPPPGAPSGLTPPPGAPSGLTPPPGAPGPAYARGSGAGNTAGTIALIAAILNFFCLPVFGALIGVMLGRVGMNRAKQGLATNGGVAKAGFWLGIAGLILAALSLLLIIATAAMSEGSA